ncbi:cytoskeleton-associated protein 2-like isoform X2 [Cuculus canorus]|uniref:cytoskeleton-associated protein 2-like isoform X2 n=1 Tax=Cuculus canorus TaxID=55661 RepID=UPI0023AB1D2D|nr:cytoskeleton-associated protein 2-like isoform X2 [Cuculus canorus]
MERAGASDERRKQLQDYLAAKEKLKHLNTKPFLKDQTNHLNPALEPISELGNADGIKKDVRNTVKGTQRGGKLTAKSTQHREPSKPIHAGHTPQHDRSNMSQRAVVRPEQPRKTAKLPVGLVPSMSHSTQLRGRPSTSVSGHLDPEKNKKPVLKVVTAAAPQTGSDNSALGTSCSLNEGLQDRLVCNKENVRAQTSTHPVLNRVFQSDKNSFGSRKVSAHRQSSAITSRTIMGLKDGIGSRQAKEQPIQDKFRKTLPGSQSVSQKPSVKTQHSSRPLQMKSSSTKPPPSIQHQRTTNPKSSLKPDSAVQWQRPIVSGKADRKDTKVVPLGCTAASQATAPQNQPRSTYGFKTQTTGSDFRNTRDRLKPELLKASGVQARRVPKTPTAADRKKQLEEWLASKGKAYKRPPMVLLQKTAVKPPCRNAKEKEKQEKPEELFLEKIDNLLTECLKLVEEGAQAEELSALLSHVPLAEKFAKFWICKAKLLARNGPFDVTGLYKAAVCAGAVPLQELREVVLDILKAGDQTSEGEKAEEPIPQKPATPCPSEGQHEAATPRQTGTSLTSLPVSIKLKVTSASRGKELLEGRELKFLTPVRRSLRIEQVGSHYPEMLKDHDPVVSSLSEILDAEEETQFFFRKNKALPEVEELEGLSSYPPDCC